MGMPSAAIAAMTDGDKLNHVLCTWAMSTATRLAMRRTVCALHGFQGATESVAAAASALVGLAGWCLRTL